MLILHPASTAATITNPAMRPKAVGCEKTTACRTMNALTTRGNRALFATMGVDLESTHRLPDWLAMAYTRRAGMRRVRA